MFDQATDRRVEKFTQSVTFDHQLYAQDIQGSIAHALMLSKVGVLTDDERHQIVTGLEQIHREIAAGEFQFRGPGACVFVASPRRIAYISPTRNPPAGEDCAHPESIPIPQRPGDRPRGYTGGGIPPSCA